MKKIFFIFLLISPLLFISSCEEDIQDLVYGCLDLNAINYNSEAEVDFTLNSTGDTINNNPCVYIGAEIIVVDPMGEPKPGITVTTSASLDLASEVFREGITDEFGKVYFYYENIAILKVIADSGIYYGESLVILEFIVIVFYVSQKWLMPCKFATTNIPERLWVCFEVDTLR